MEFRAYNCECGMKFQAACHLELQEKLRSHKCPKPINKRIERTKQLQQTKVDQFVNDTTVNRIEEHNFDQLVREGMIVQV